MCSSKGNQEVDNGIGGLRHYFVTARSGLGIDLAPQIRQATRARHAPVSVSLSPCVPVSELWWVSPTPRDGCRGRAAGGRCQRPGPCARQGLVCGTAGHREPLPSSQRPHPLSLTPGAVLWPPRGALLVKQRRKRKRGEAQPARSLPRDLPAHLRRWGMGGKGASVTSPSGFLGRNCCEHMQV